MDCMQLMTEVLDPNYSHNEVLYNWLMFWYWFAWSWWYWCWCRVKWEMMRWPSLMLTGAKMSWEQKQADPKWVPPGDTFFTIRTATNVCASYARHQWVDHLSLIWSNTWEEGIFCITSCMKKKNWPDNSHIQVILWPMNCHTLKSRMKSLLPKVSMISIMK